MKIRFVDRPILLFCVRENRYIGCIKNAEIRPKEHVVVVKIKNKKSILEIGRGYLCEHIFMNIIR